MFTLWETETVFDFKKSLVKLALTPATPTKARLAAFGINIFLVDLQTPFKLD